MKAEYLPIMIEINRAISKFNEFLCEARKIPQININEDAENSYVTKIIQGNWIGFQIKNPQKSGVYFILGREIHQQQPSVYIGKASFQSKVSDRIYKHLVQHKNSDSFIMNGKNGEKFLLEYAVSIDLESNGLQILSSSLEEFLINELRVILRLMNAVGNL